MEEPIKSSENETQKEIVTTGSTPSERRCKEEANKETYKPPIMPELNIHIFLDIKLDKELQHFKV